MQIDSKTYEKAFVHYLRRGTPLDVFLKSDAAAHPTTHYIWMTAGDDKVRLSHAANHGKIFAWDNPPATGHPGEERYCRCTAVPYYQPDPSKIDDPPIEPVYPELLIPIFGLGKILFGIARALKPVSTNTLTEAQAKNLARFDKKLPKDAKEIQVLKSDGNKRVFRADVPARNIEGSFARYEKTVDEAGKTLSYTKTTYAPDGSIVHVKVK